MLHRLLTKNSLKYYKNKQVNYLSNTIIPLFLSAICKGVPETFGQLVKNICHLYLDTNITNKSLK